MNITLSIDSSIWQYELDKFNATEAAKITNGNASASAQHEAIMRQTPEVRRTKFTPAPDFVPLTTEEFVAKFVSEREAASLATKTADHLAVLARQSPETIAKLVAQVDEGA